VQAKSTLTCAGSASAGFRQALAQYATGVTVITTLARDGTPAGMTVNSFTSVSLDPPLVLWSVSRQAASFDAFRQCSRYLVHVLGADQLPLAQRFATRGADKFGTTPWTPGPHGLPLIEGSVAWFDCASRSQYDEGDHVILVGRVESFGAAGGNPLIFHASRYVTDLSEAPLPSQLLKPW
jgi:flavin reductase (DIM6/NTAB) family NADH-FMN oxidoreductase RutF